MCLGGAGDTVQVLAGKLPTFVRSGFIFYLFLFSRKRAQTVELFCVLKGEAVSGDGPKVKVKSHKVLVRIGVAVI